MANMSKYRVGDRFVVRLRAKTESGNYILDSEHKSLKDDFLVVSEEYLDNCYRFDIYGSNKRVKSPELKDCPFCGCKMQMVECQMIDGRTLRYEPRGRHKHGCALEHATYVGWPTKVENSAKKWNRRKLCV